MHPLQLGILWLVCLVAMGCVGCSSGSSPQMVAERPVAQPPPEPTQVDFRDEIIYFALTDRFFNGDPGNDNGDLSRAGDAADVTNPVGWHGGDFAGLAQKIDEGYFQRMGFTAIWISPVVEQVPAPTTGGGVNAGRLFSGFHGYWAEDFFATEPHFGTLAELETLVDTAHGAGMKIILDVVVNHAGPGAQLVSDRPEWFRTGSQCGTDLVTQCLFGLPDFRQERSDVTEFLFDTVAFLRDETGFDGIRMDTMKHVPDEFWTEFFAADGPADPTALWTVGEVFSTSVTDIDHFFDLGSPSLLDFPLQAAINQTIARGGSTARLAQVFAQDSVYADATLLSTFVDNHDIKRFMSEALPGRSRGEAEERLDMALSLIYLARGIPVVYYGTEIAMEGEGDSYSLPLGRSSREDMDFSALAGSRFDERLATLARARTDYPALKRGSQRTLFDPASASSCKVADSGLDPAADFGDEMFVRGSFDGWADPPPASQRFVNQGSRIYTVRFEIPAGDHQFKIAAADWSPEFANLTTPTVVGVPITLNSASGAGTNSQISLGQTACYEFELSAASTANPVLTVNNAGAVSGADVFAFARELVGEAPVLVIVNNSDSPVELADLPGGGIDLAGALQAGVALQEITGAATNLTSDGGMLRGTLPARVVFGLVSN